MNDILIGIGAVVAGGGLFGMGHVIGYTRGYKKGGHAVLREWKQTMGDYYDE